MGLLDSGTLPKQLERATRKWDALDLENAAQDAAVPLVMCRTRKEFQATEQGQRHAAAPLIHIEKIGDSEPEPFPAWFSTAFRHPRARYGACCCRTDSVASVGRPGCGLPKP